MSNPINFATSQPFINYTGSHEVGIGGCNIDTNSNLKLVLFKHLLNQELVYNKDHF